MKVVGNYEILAPAGSYDCLKAAICAGADAVYAGGNLFGARAFAENFQGEELISAIQYAHIHGRKFYLTVNTLLKNREIEQLLYEYLKPLYCAGLDAVIVQDFGVMCCIHEMFPDLPIHASTQMNITGAYFAESLKSYGVTRIVTARELSLPEIRGIYEKTGMEIESFVHGALCYGYSGQCLLSSMIGGRSGNRGKCAQPCRLAYDLVSTQNKTKINSEKCNYMLSPKDLCTLEILPQILEAGVFSLKIEGRMKKPEYVASVTAMYRKYLDLYQTVGKEGYQVKACDIEQLKEIYNRGGFTDGYYNRPNGNEMISMKRPNHCGVEVGKVKTISKMIVIQTEKALKKGDVLEFDCHKQSCNYTIGEPVKKDAKIQIRNKFQNGLTLLPKDFKSMSVFRIRDNELIGNISSQYLKTEAVSKVTGYAVFEIGKPAQLFLDCHGVSITVFGAVVLQAENRPLAREDIEEKLRKTGGTAFEFETLTVVCEEGIFLPVKELNELRRMALERLEQELISKSERKSKERIPVLQKMQHEINRTDTENSITNQTAVLISKPEQFEVVLEQAFVRRIYLESAWFSEDDMEQMILQAKEAGKEIYLALPYIFRKKSAENWKNHQDFYENAAYDGLVLRNLEEYFFCKQELTVFAEKAVIFDSNVYCFNSYSAAYLQQFRPLYLSNSLELNARELEQCQISNLELQVYGYLPILFSANCVKKSLGSCDGKMGFGELALKDRKGEEFFVANNCRHCYNILYYPKPLSLFDEADAVRSLRPASVRLNFTMETKEETEQILREFLKVFREEGVLLKESKNRSLENTCKGHFRRGVQ